MTPLDSLLTCLRFPSVSTDSVHVKDVRACAEWLAEFLRASGLTAAIHPTAGHPIVVARNAHRPGRPTVMLYGHYDVQPADPLALWESPPFEPRIADGILYARGATDNKGQMMAHINGLRQTMAAHGDLPVNLIALFEGEEEIGSPHLGPFLAAHQGDLACDVIAISDTGMIGPGVPTFTYGLRGIACCEIEVLGPKVDLHSGIFGGAVANPATELARLIARFHDAEGHIQIDGFYDAVRPLESWERQAWASLPLTDGELLRITGSPALHGEAGFTSLERLWARPTAEINGIGGGYQGEGSKTVLPSRAFAKCSFRLVPDQDPEELLPKIEAWLKARVPPTVMLNVRIGHSGQPYVMDPHSRFGLAAQDALRATFNGLEPALIREGGSIPIVRTFKDILGADTLLLGLALPDSNAHAPNENFPLAHFEAGQRLNRHLLEKLAAA